MYPSILASFPVGVGDAEKHCRGNQDQRRGGRLPPLAAALPPLRSPAALPAHADRVQDRRVHRRAVGRPLGPGWRRALGDRPRLAGEEANEMMN